MIRGYAIYRHARDRDRAEIDEGLAPGFYRGRLILPEGEMAEQLIELEAARSLTPLSLESFADARIFCTAATIMADKILRVRPIIIWRTKERIECGSQTVRRSRLGLIGPHR